MDKKRLETLLEGGIPDVPPHFELVFQLEEEYFKMSWNDILEKDFASENQKADAVIKFHTDVYLNVMNRFQWAAVPAPGGGGVDFAKGIEHMKNAVGNQALVFSYSMDGVYWMPTGSDMMDFVVMLFEQPKAMHENARKKCKEAKQLAKRQKEAGADFIVQNTDFGFNDAPFISPSHFAEFVTPYMQEIVGYMHDIGLKVILHSDGNLNQILDQIFSTGVDGYQSVDPQGSMDIKKVRQDYPDWLLMGNVACNMLQDTDEELIRESVRYCMEHGGIGKRYIFSTSNCIFKSMPPRSYEVMLDEYNRLCTTAIKGK
jgi:uroporphyrinogen decarboxylase